MSVGTWEKAKAVLKDGDILLYTPVPGIAAAISWAQWINGHEDDKYCHAGLVYDITKAKGFEQNPPATHYTDLSQEDWTRIDIWRVRDAIPLDTTKLRAWCDADLGTPYPYAKYFRFIGAAALARLGLTRASLGVASGGKTVSDPHWEVCSATVADAVNHARVNPAQVIWGTLAEDERPADLPLGAISQVA